MSKQAILGAIQRGLKRGPLSADAQATPAAEATKVVHMQAADWRTYRDRVAAAAPAAITERRPTTVEGNLCSAICTLPTLFVRRSKATAAKPRTMQCAYLGPGNASLPTAWTLLAWTA